MAPGPSAIWRRDRNFAACAVHLSSAVQDAHNVGAPISHSEPAFRLSAARLIAHRVGAQHSSRKDAALFRHLPQFTLGLIGSVKLNRRRDSFTRQWILIIELRCALGV